MPIGTRSCHLLVLPLLYRLLHGLECVSCQLGRYDELLLNVLDLLHHVGLELGEGFLQLRAALQRRRRGVGSNMGAVFAALRAQWLVDGVEIVDGGELVVEDVGPRIAPLFCGRLDLRWLSARTCHSALVHPPSPASGPTR